MKRGSLPHGGEGEEGEWDGIVRHVPLHDPTTPGGDDLKRGVHVGVLDLWLNGDCGVERGHDEYMGERKGAGDGLRWERVWLKEGERVKGWRKY